MVPGIGQNKKSGTNWVFVKNCLFFGYTVYNIYIYILNTVYIVYTNYIGSYRDI